MQKSNLTQNTDKGVVKRKKMALGRGLGALIPDFEKEEDKKKDYFHFEASC